MLPNLYIQLESLKKYILMNSDEILFRRTSIQPWSAERCQSRSVFGFRISANWPRAICAFPNKYGSIRFGRLKSPVLHYVGGIIIWLLQTMWLKQILFTYIFCLNWFVQLFFALTNFVPISSGKMLTNLGSY